MDRYIEIIEEAFEAPKLVSVFIPSRTRFALLKESVNSLRATMTNPDDLEVLVAVDNDDEDTLSQLHLLGDIKVTIGEYVGYSGTAYRHNKMFEMSSGEFLLLWGDDAVMLSKGWDDVVRSYRGRVCIPFTKNETTCFIHRAIPTAWGMFTPYYCAEIIYKLIALELGVYARHDEIYVINVPAEPVGRDIGTHMSSEGWFKYKDDIYKFTDTFKQYTVPLPFTPPLEKHPINDIERGKVYWGPGTGNWKMPPSIG